MQNGPRSGGSRRSAAVAASARMTYESASLGFIQCGHRDLCGVFISVLKMVRLACGSCGDIVPEGVVLYWGISEYVLLRKGEAELQSL